MCDPITIIGLAASVVQIVDITGRLISKSCEIYQSTDGAFQENAELEFITTDLQTTNARLAKIPLQFGSDNDLDHDDRAIRELCVGCNEVADELLQQLSLLKLGRNDKDSRKMESVKYAWKFVRSKRNLEALAARVAAYREQLHTRIMVSLTERFDGLQLQQTWRFDSLERTGREILDSIKQSQILISTDLENQTDYLTRLARAHHDEVIARLDIITELGSRSLCPSPFHDPDSNHTWSGNSHEPSNAEDLAIHKLTEIGDYKGMQEHLRLKPDAIFNTNFARETPLHIAAREGDLKMISYLLRKGAKKNADDIYDQTPLHLAVKAGNAATVRFLISQGANPDTEDENGNSPLHSASSKPEISWILKVGAGLEDRDEKGFTAVREFVRLGDIDTVRSFLDNGADVNARLESTFPTPLFEAAHASDLAMMDLLITRGATLDERDNRDGTLLVVLAARGLDLPIRKLLDYGANINAFNELKFTALHEACYSQHLREETALILIEKGAHFGMETVLGQTPIAMASQSGSELIIRRLLENGADASVSDGGGWTPLHEACEHGHPEVVKLLLEHGAGTDAKTDDGYTPLSRAAQQGQLECVRVMLDMGADVDLPGCNRWSALHEACEHDYPEIVKLLVEHGANTVARTNGDYTPLSLAAQHGRLDCVRIMLKMGADINLPGCNGWSALHEACEHGHPEVVRLLLEGGASIDAMNNSGCTPLFQASQEGHLECMKMVQEFGHATTKP